MMLMARMQSSKIARWFCMVFVRPAKPAVGGFDRNQTHLANLSLHKDVATQDAGSFGDATNSGGVLYIAVWAASLLFRCPYSYLKWTTGIELLLFIAVLYISSSLSSLYCWNPVFYVSFHTKLLQTCSLKGFVYQWVPQSCSTFERTEIDSVTAMCHPWHFANKQCKPSRMNAHHGDLVAPTCTPLQLSLVCWRLWELDCGASFHWCPNFINDLSLISLM